MQFAASAKLSINTRQREKERNAQDSPFLSSVSLQCLSSTQTKRSHLIGEPGEAAISTSHDIELDRGGRKWALGQHRG